MNVSGQQMFNMPMAFPAQWPGLFSLAQVGGGVSLWRAGLALAMTVLAVAMVVGVAGFAQRWVVGRRIDVTALVVFAVGLMMGLLLWMAAWLLRLASSPGLGYETFRPFVQTVAHCCAIGIAVAVALMPCMMLLDRRPRLGGEQARRGAGRVLLHSAIVVVIGAVLYEPFFLAVGSARPTPEDFVIGLPVGEFFAGLMFLLIALAAASPCVAAVHRAERWEAGDSDPVEASSWLHGPLPWVVAALCLPCSFVCYRLALKWGHYAAGPGQWIDGLGGGANQPLPLHFIRWCVLYGITIAVSIALGSRLMRLAAFNGVMLKPISTELHWLGSVADLWPWRKKTGQHTGIAAGDKPAPLPHKPMTTPTPASTSGPATSEISKPIAMPAAPTAVLPPAPTASQPVAAEPVESQGQEKWEALPIDPRTGLIREDVARRIREQLEQDASPIAPPPRRRQPSTEHQPATPKVVTPIEAAPVREATVAEAVMLPQRVRSLRSSTPAGSSSSPRPASPLNDPPSSWRWHLALLLLIYVAMTWHASMVPLNYQPLPMAQAWQKFKSMESFNVADNPNRRADFVANIALFVPIGFLGMSVLALGRRSKAVALAGAVVVAAGCSLLAWGIEFRQLWYPPRTVSWNDLIAEHLGGLIGIGVWLLIGHGVMSRLAQIRSQAGTVVARHRLLQLYAVGLFLFCILPMDFTLSPGRILDKVKSISFGGDLLSGGAMAWGRVVRDLAGFLAVGMLACLHGDRLPILCDPQRSRRTPAAAATLVLIYAAAIEFIKLFMVNGVVDLMNLPVRTLGGFLGARLALKALDENAAWRIGMNWPHPRRPLVALAFCFVHAALLFALLAPPWRVNWDAKLIGQQLSGMTDGLFVNYYYAGEWKALTNLTHYALLFVPLGLLLRWGLHSPMRDEDEASASSMGRRFTWLTPIVACLLVGGAIEVMQGGLDRAAAPLQSGEDGAMPDATDLLAYTAGALTGWLFMGLFLPGNDKPRLNESRT